MPLLCFLLDLRNVSHSLFQDLKQSLLQLANLYAVTAGRQERYGLTDEALMLPDRIGLCYIQRSESSTSSAEDAASRSVTVEFVVIVQDDDLFSEYLEKQRRFMYNVNQLHQCVIIKDGNGKKAAVYDNAAYDLP
ncbi:hypothetical protein AXF42_Ash002227 [Apostasia shenzhenica]|uniref:Uncharacterized protein n=1 Tax=Apostasia shenzhenica TaxID=1088818 RepID=A0A2I0AN22_9ASPA|nr:hypothetical protein AXF42_Ash002227 [Apostasia shenzhenica]